MIPNYIMFKWRNINDTRPPDDELIMVLMESGHIVETFIPQDAEYKDYTRMLRKGDNKPVAWVLLWELTEGYRRETKDETNTI